MSLTSKLETCPICGKSTTIRSKTLLIDEAWVWTPGKDAREVCHASMRVDDVKPDRVREKPLEQFLDGYYCDQCGKGFVSEDDLKADRRRYH